MALLDDIKQSISTMQERMQHTYSELNSLNLEGISADGKVTLIMTATYQFVDLQFDEDALFGGIDKLKQRIKEAWEDLSNKIKNTTQSQTASLLQDMDIPNEISEMEALPAEIDAEVEEK